MIRYIIRKVLYGLLVLWGVITVLFFLLKIDPESAARVRAGKNPTPELIEQIKKDFQLDLPLYQQYMLYLNDLSPISIHNETVEDSRVYLNDDNYSYTKLFSYSEYRTVVIKYPYLRRDYLSNEKVSEIINAHIPETAILAITAIGIAVLLGIVLGVLAALYKGSFIDGAALVISTMGMSVPSFFMAIVVQWIMATLWFEETSLPIFPLIGIAAGTLIGLIFNKREAAKRFTNFSWIYLSESMFKGFIIALIAWVLGYALLSFGIEIPLIDSYLFLPGTDLPTSGTFNDLDEIGDEFINYPALVLPALTLGIRPLAIVMQLTRSSMLDVLSQDYVRTAKAKGLKPIKIIGKHALKNALNPVVTAVSGWFASMLAGAIFIEEVFNWNGIGKVIYDGIDNSNLPVVIGAVTIIAAFFVIINIVVDIVYGILDPRVRVK